MNAERGKAGGRCRTERGAALVEFALIFPIFMTLVLGMFSGGQAWNHKSAMTSATREGARYGSTLPIETIPPALPDYAGWLHEVAEYVERASEGSLGTGAPGRTICVAYVYSPGAGLDLTVHHIHPTGPLVAPGPCPGANDAPPDDKPRVQVVTSRSSKIQALFFQYGLTLSTKTITRFEATP